MEYVYFILFVAFLIAALVLLARFEARAKGRYRKAAYNLLEQPNAPAGEIKQTIRGLRLYGGRWRRDKEFLQLIARLKERLENAGE